MIDFSESTPILNHLDDYRVLAHRTPTTPDEVSYVLGLPVDDLDGRSDWEWIALADGSLIFGCFPLSIAFETLMNGEV